MRFLITGASRGLGLALAEQLVAAGHVVTGVGRTGSPAAAALEQVSGGRFCWRLADLTATADLAGLAGALQGALLPDWVILNAASTADDLTADGLDAVRLRQVLATNLGAPLELVAALLPAMRARGWGGFVAISSLSARRATAQGQVAYPASKAGLSMAFEALRRQTMLAPIRFLTVEPGLMTAVAAPPFGVSYAVAAERIAALIADPHGGPLVAFPAAARLAFAATALMPQALIRWLGQRRQASRARLKAANRP